MLLDETNSEVHKFRLNRVIHIGMQLSQSDSYCPNSNALIGFDGVEFTEPSNNNSNTLSPLPILPNRRNVALTSIFRSGLTANSSNHQTNLSLDFGDSGSGTGGISPTSSTASISPMNLVYSSNMRSNINDGGNLFNQANNGDIFRSIWTPDEEEKVASEANAWN